MACALWNCHFIPSMVLVGSCIWIHHCHWKHAFLLAPAQTCSDLCILRSGSSWSLAQYTHTPSTRMKLTAIIAIAISIISVAHASAYRGKIAPHYYNDMSEADKAQVPSRVDETSSDEDSNSSDEDTNQQWWLISKINPFHTFQLINLIIIRLIHKIMRGLLGFSSCFD